MTGPFITFEGIEGCGKTTQIKLLAEYLRKQGKDVVLTREPGGTKIGDAIRQILLDAGNKNMSPVAELLLYAAAREQHIKEVIMPAMNAGKTVLCDRYADATTAYQGAARKIDPKIIEEVHRISTEGLKPELTLLFDCPPEVGLARARSRNERTGAANKDDRFEQEALDFHTRVREGYLAIAKKEPKRFVIIDATESVEDIFKNIIQTADSRLQTTD